MSLTEKLIKKFSRTQARTLAVVAIISIVALGAILGYVFAIPDLAIAGAVAGAVAFAGARAFAIAGAVAGAALALIYTVVAISIAFDAINDEYAKQNKA